MAPTEDQDQDKDGQPRFSSVFSLLNRHSLLDISAGRLDGCTGGEDGEANCGAQMGGHFGLCIITRAGRVSAKGEEGREAWELLGTISGSGRGCSLSCKLPFLFPFFHFSFSLFLSSMWL